MRAHHEAAGVRRHASLVRETLMRLATALARFLPIDPGYTPFGLPWLRGLNVLHFALVGFVGLFAARQSR
jgi:hypothetical protein